MNHTLLTPRYYRNEESFIRLANDNTRYIRYKDGTFGYQPFVTHQHIVQPDIQPKAVKLYMTGEEKKAKDISELTAKRIRDNLIGERDVFTKYGYDEANELNETLREIRTLKGSQGRIRNRIAEIGCHLDILVQAAEGQDEAMTDD
jgi:hypothetical protein